jgi:hypothetical protein
MVIDGCELMAEAVQVMTNGSHGTFATQFWVESKAITIVVESRNCTCAGVELLQDLLS